MQQQVGEKTLNELYKLFDSLSDIPVSNGTDLVEADTLELPFLHFPIGTHREEVWHWFEAQNPHFIVGEVLQGTRRSDSVTTLRRVE